MPSSRRVAFVVLLLHMLLFGCQPRPADHASPGQIPPSPTESSSVEVTQDASGATVVRIKPPVAAIIGQPRLVAGATLPHGELPDNVLVGFRFASRSWQFEGCRRMSLLANGREIATTAVRREAQLGQGNLTELLYGMVPFESVRQLATASTIEALLCQSRFDVRADDRRSLAAFVERLSGGR